MIPKELIQQWEKEAEEHASIGNKKWSLDHNSSMNNYIAGRRAQYLQMQAEIERLKGLLENRVKNDWRDALINAFGESDEDVVEKKWQQFKTEHNL